MKNGIFLLDLMVWLALVSGAHANTNYVVSGASVQAGINACAPGDTLVVQAGSYPDNIVFTNPITVLCSGTNPPATNILFQGTVLIEGTGPMNFAGCQFLNSATMALQGTGTVSFAQCQFTPSLAIAQSGTVSFNQCVFLSSVSTANANLLLSQCTCSATFSANLSGPGGTNLQAFTSNFANLSAVGGKTTLKRCNLTTLSLSGSASFEGLQVTNAGQVSATATAGSGATFTAVQSTFGTQPDITPLSLANYNVWLGYNYITASDSQAPEGYGAVELFGCDSILAGNIVQGSFPGAGVPDGNFGHYEYGLYTQGGTISAYNNSITISGSSSYALGYSAIIGLYLINTALNFQNNSIIVSGSAGGGGYSMGLSGVIVSNAPLGSIFLGDYFRFDGSANTANAISGYGQNPAGLSYCAIVSVWASSGVTFANCYTNYPGPDEGPPDPIYYNNGTTTRNDIGFDGGPYYNASYYTTSNPIVFYLTGAPQTVFKGQQTNIVVNVAASAGH